jgi:hypothetical protein
MARALPIGKPEAGLVGRMKLMTFNHRVVTGSSGAIASQDDAKDSGIVAAKTGSETGRYTLTIPGGRFRQFRGGTVSIVGADDAAYGAVSVGLHAIFRDDDLSSDGTLEVQFLSASTNFADAEPPNGTIFVVDFKARV